jgi:hypothetical protein
MIAILLVPVCIGAVKALARIIDTTGQANSFWLVLGGGMASWLAIYLLLPKPMLIYVFGHELTHVLWTWLFGGRVRKFKVTSKGGHVILSKSNFLIALAPYFFPLYVVLVVILFAAGHLIWGWTGYLVWFHWLLGLAYGFHLTLTFHILKTRQSDITSQGVFFSAVVIFLGNVAVLLLGLPLLTARVGISTALGWWLQESGTVILRLRDVF